MIKSVDLSILKDLVASLEASLKLTTDLSEDVKSNRNKYVIECHRATGIAGGIMQEAALLITDISALVQEATNPGGKDILKELSKLTNSGGKGGFGGTGFGGN